MEKDREAVPVPADGEVTGTAPGRNGIFETVNLNLQELFEVLSFACSTQKCEMTSVM